MGYFDKTKTVVVTTVLVVAMTALMSAEAQDIPACATGLAGCDDYLNATTKPPASCCDPLKQAVSKQLPCLCKLYNDTGLLKSLGINVTQAVRLPSLCGVPGGGDLCQGGKNTSSPSPSGPASGPPKGNVGSAKNDAGRLASTGIFSGLLIWASLMLH